MALPPLAPLAAPDLIARANRVLADGPPDAAARALVGENPLAWFGLICAEGVLGAYLFDEPARVAVGAALAGLFARWVREDFHPADPAEQLAAACFTAQCRYLEFQFAGLHGLDDARRARARQAHRAMTRAALDRDQGRRAAARDGLARAFADWQAAQDPYFQAQVAADWGALLEAEGALAEAYARLDFAVGVARQLGDLERLGRRFLHRGKLALRRGDPEGARRDYREAAGVCRVLRDVPGLIVALAAEGETLRLTGATLDAEAAFAAAAAAADAHREPALRSFVDEARRGAAAPPAN